MPIKQNYSASIHITGDVFLFSIAMLRNIYTTAVFSDGSSMLGQNRTNTKLWSRKKPAIIENIENITMFDCFS